MGRYECQVVKRNLLKCRFCGRGGVQLYHRARCVPDKYATIAVEQVLRDGGNAVVASIAASFVLAVTFPKAANIGGGGFMLVRMDG